MKNNFFALTTHFTNPSFSWEAYPRPQLKRDSFFSLNGKWNLALKSKNKSEDLGEIIVPFPPESTLSQIGKTLKKSEQFLYSKTFTLPKGFCKDRIILHFGAVDQIATVFVNGTLVGMHEGGYLPFCFDITNCVFLDRENQILVEVTDNLDKTFPYGKQRKKRGGMWYTPISGIWQTVWIESVTDNYIKNIKLTPKSNEITICVDGAKGEKSISIDGLPQLDCKFNSDSITLTIPSPIFWSPDNPHLYHFTLSCGGDTVRSYFALRDVSYKTINGKNYISLNGEPLFINALLDQGYFPDGIFLPSSPEGYLNDILTAKKFGFNTLRKHIKIEPLLFYYYCDCYGILVMQDMVNNGKYNFVTDTALPTIGIKMDLGMPEGKKQRQQFLKDSLATIELLYNSPSIIYYTIFNEGWGQFDTDNVYTTLKQADTTRVFDATSGWFAKRKSDVDSRHVYFKKLNLIAGEKPLILSEFGGYSYKVENHSFNLKKTYGYKKLTSQAEFENEIEKLYLDEVLPCIKNGLNGAVLTQISDVEDETNGLLTYDRKIEKISSEKMQQINAKLNKAFKEVLNK